MADDTVNAERPQRSVSQAPKEKKKRFWRRSRSVTPEADPSRTAALETAYADASAENVAVASDEMVADPVLDGDPSKEVLKNYFKSARTWEKDRVRSAERSKKVAWSVAVCAVVLSAVLGAGLAVASQQRAEVVVVRVDSATGIVDVPAGLANGPDSYDEAVDEYFLRRYVLARENYSEPERRARFEEVALLSSPDAAENYRRWWNVNNPASPQAVFGATGTVRAEIRRISFLDRGVAQVHFYRTTDLRGVSDREVWVSTIHYSYTDRPLTQTQRWNNPLGFVVTSYRVDLEAA